VRLNICGARGSTPAPGPDYLRYGGHTSCVAVTADGDDVPTLILDAGTGIRAVTGLLAGQPYAGHILLSHLHWDHVHGLPFFRAGDTPGAQVTLLLPAQPGGQAAEAVLAGCMSPPHFPITPGELRGEWTFAVVPAEAFKAGSFEVEAREIPHKGGTTVGYRISDGRSAVAYLPDHCPTLAGPGPDGWGEYHPAALALAREVDLLIHDASLLPAELAAEASFGHAAADYAVGLARYAGARMTVLFHHKPDRDDDALDALGARLARSGAAVMVAAEQDILQT
jgi:phosphoribosyl 1,2-cyclic phosphodiesterase